MEAITLLKREVASSGFTRVSLAAEEGCRGVQGRSGAGQGGQGAVRKPLIAAALG